MYALAWCRRAAVALVLIAGTVTSAHAQEIVNLDQAIGRARALVEAGNGRAGRMVLDSLVQRTPVGSPALGELLYWRGLLSESGTDAERDWQRLLLEVPMSPRAEDALLRLAQLAQLRGRPAESRVLLERMARDFREPSSQARAHFWLAKALFDENDRPRACGALDLARRDAPPSAVELRTQMDDLRKRCTGITAVAPIQVATGAAAPVVAAPVAAPPASTLRADSLRADSARSAAQRADVSREDMLRRQAQRITADSLEAVNAAKGSSAATTRVAAPPAATTNTTANTTATAGTTANTAATAPANARYSVQLAAYQRLDQAQALVRQLIARNVDARVDGTVAPFRVRTGYFTTRAQAAARLAELKKDGHDGFVAERTP